MSSLVVRGGDGFEPLLTSGVPDLELDGAAAGLESSDFEVNADGWEEAA
jgi:hypothetical protein